MFTDLSKFDWVLKENKVIIPANHNGTTNIKFASQQSKDKVMIRIRLNNSI